MYNCNRFQVILPLIFLIFLTTGCSDEDNTDPVDVQDDTSNTTIDNTQADVPGAVLFFDDFEYSVSRGGDAGATGTGNTFTSEGGWSRVKAINITGSHAGYLYTRNQIPGYSGSFPGSNSNSVLVIEAVPATIGSQSDFYLQYGEESGATDAVPGDVWFQFWIYPNRYDDPADVNDQMSLFENRLKFIYPCNGPYPCQPGEINWLYTFGYTTGEPHWANTSMDQTQLFMTNIGDGSSVDYQPAPDWNQFKLGQTDVSENIVPNRWTLVKIHYDTSTTSGTFEAWLKPLGGDQVKVAEWIDGQTPDFIWQVPASDTGGHIMFRMPTTIDDHDSWVYLDDFAMATSEDALPVYPY